MSDQNQAAELPISLMACVTRCVAHLLCDLERAASAKVDGVKQERLRYIFILTKLSKFVQDVGAPLEPSIYIRDLALALHDLETGVVNPILTREKVGNRGSSSKIWRSRAAIAVGLEALIRAGMSRQVAAATALKDLPRIKRLMTKKSKTPTKAILSWYDDLCRDERRIKNGQQRRIKNGEWTDSLKVGIEFVNASGEDRDSLRTLARIQFRRASRI